MKLAKVILITAAITVLLVFLTGLIGLAISTFKFLFWAAILAALIVLAIKLLGGRKSTTSYSSNYGMKELESWDKMFEDYKQGTDYKTK
ncbi:MAG TPA: hypothetical protein VFZ34_26970 [Blastocatellia bacterium]|nr:hypothetical protein [Blastocatellia bacterium]